MKYKYFIIVLLSCVLNISVFAQDTLRTFRNLELALKNPDEVVKLDLSKQKLDEFPMEILQFKNLRELNLSKNKIKDIPSEIGKLTELQVVDFSKNRLSALPVGLFSCTKITRLIANQNAIIEIPKEIIKLQDLEYLDMWSNDLWVVPDEIKGCKKLKEFDLRVIEMTQAEQERIMALLPDTKLHFSAHCNCSR